MLRLLSRLTFFVLSLGFLMIPGCASKTDSSKANVNNSSSIGDEKLGEKQIKKLFHETWHALAKRHHLPQKLPPPDPPALPPPECKKIKKGTFRTALMQLQKAWEQYDMDIERQAIKAFKAIIKQDPNCSSAYRVLAGIAYEHDEWEKSFFYTQKTQDLPMPSFRPIFSGIYSEEELESYKKYERTKFTKWESFPNSIFLIIYLEGGKEWLRIYGRYIEAAVSEKKEDLNDIVLHLATVVMFPPKIFPLLWKYNNLENFVKNDPDQRLIKIIRYVKKKAERRVSSGKARGAQ